MENPITTPLPADLPENWQTSQIVAPDGADAGLSEQHGYNYLMRQVNAAQEGVNALGEALEQVPELDGSGKLPASSLPAATADAVGGVKIGANIQVTADGAISTHAPYTLPIASGETLGGVRLGNYMTINENGNLTGNFLPLSGGEMADNSAISFPPTNDPNNFRYTTKIGQGFVRIELLRDNESPDPNFYNGFSVVDQKFGRISFNSNTFSIQGLNASGQRVGMVQISDRQFGYDNQQASAYPEYYIKAPKIVFSSAEYTSPTSPIVVSGINTPEQDTDAANKAYVDEKYTYSTADLESGVSPLETGKLYFVYE